MRKILLSNVFLILTLGEVNNSKKIQDLIWQRMIKGKEFLILLTDSKALVHLTIVYIWIKSDKKDFYTMIKIFFIIILLNKKTSKKITKFFKVDKCHGVAIFIQIKIIKL